MSAAFGHSPKRVLFLTPQLPYPPEQGTALRNYNLIAQVARSHTVGLLSFTQRLPSSAELEHLQGFCDLIMTVPAPARTLLDRLKTLVCSREPDLAWRLRSSAFAEALVALVIEWQPDVVQVEGIELGRYASLMRTHFGQRPAIVFDDHNAEYLLQRRAARTDLRQPHRWGKAVYSLVQARRLRRFEAQRCRQADAVLAVSPDDAEAIAAIAPDVDVRVIPNGVDTGRYRPGLADTLPLRHPAVVFTGKMDFRPNIDAVVWFVERVWPQVHAIQPDAMFYIVGKAPTGAVRALSGHSGVCVTGYVEDILPYFGGADLYVVPLRVGGGTRLKVLEAMAAGLPLVSTTLGAEGIGARNGRDLLLADDPVAFAEAVLRLLADRRQAVELGRAARAFVERHYDWSAITPPLSELLAAL
ncbi:MAG: glycosyltransferase [Chloroflexi bacterium]|nr:glycosyltransferase [Chloroflexota bacterium]